MREPLLKKRRLTIGIDDPILDFMMGAQTLATGEPKIHDGARVKLVAWMIDTCVDLKLCPETLHGAVNYLDRLVAQDIFKNDSKLIGLTCIWI